MVQDKDKSLRFNPASVTFNIDPYPVYQHMRSNQPLMRLGKTWILSRYQDIALALKNRAFVSSGIPEQLHAEMDRQSRKLSPALRSLLYGIVLFEDDIEHRAHRLALQALFNGESWAQLSELIFLEAQRLVARVLVVRHFDGIDDIAAPLWNNVFSKWLNLPDEQQSIVEQEKSAIRLLLDPSSINAAGMKRLLQAMENLDETFNQLFERHLSGYDSLFFRSLVKGYDGDRQTLKKRFSTDCITMLIGGSETSESLTGNMMFLLAKNPELQTGLQDNSIRLKDVILETMRFESPLQMLRRKVQAPVTLHGREMNIGDNLLLCLGSANRDESIFEQAWRFIPGRKNAQRHLGFGVGMHQCIGQILAQFQAEKIIRELLVRGNVSLVGDANWSSQSLILRTLETLPLRLG